jgi:hypothetical protein
VGTFGLALQQRHHAILGTDQVVTELASIGHLFVRNTQTCMSTPDEPYT